MSDGPSEDELKRVAGQSGRGWRWEGQVEQQQQQVTDSVNISAAVSQDSRSKAGERGSEGGETLVSERETELI